MRCGVKPVNGRMTRPTDASKTAKAAPAAINISTSPMLAYRHSRRYKPSEIRTMTFSGIVATKNHWSRSATPVSPCPSYRAQNATTADSGSSTRSHTKNARFLSRGVRPTRKFTI
jgi:hypothetical protein